MTVIIGIDPGLVHTGVVVMDFEGAGLASSAFVISGTDSHAQRVLEELNLLGVAVGTYIFIEAYRPRGTSYTTNPKMQALMADFRHVLPKAQVIDNTGVKSVVTRDLMEFLDVWTFTLSTHHQDLRSAARIALYGALKDDHLNRVVYDYVINRK